MMQPSAEGVRPHAPVVSFADHPRALEQAINRAFRLLSLPQNMHVAYADIRPDILVLCLVAI
jgi:hypothetical protein